MYLHVLQYRIEGEGMGGQGMQQKWSQKRNWWDEIQIDAPFRIRQGRALWYCGRLGAYFRKKEPAPKIYFAYNFLSRLPIEVILGSLESHNV